MKYLLIILLFVVSANQTRAQLRNDRIPEKETPSTTTAQRKTTAEQSLDRNIKRALKNNQSILEKEFTTEFVRFFSLEPGSIDEICEEKLDLEKLEEIDLLHKAVNHDLIQLVEFLLTKGMDVNKEQDNRRYTPLALAKSEEVAKLLIESGANIFAVDGDGTSVFWRIVSISKPPHSLIKLCIKNDVPYDKVAYNGTNLFLQFLEYDCRLDVLKLLIEGGGIDINTGWGEGFTALHRIAWARYYDTHEEEALNTMKFLVDNGAYINITNQWGGTPLHCVLNDVDKARFLIAHGADVNISANEGYTPLHFTTGSSRSDIALELAEVLLLAGANVNALDKEKNSTLHIAMSEKSLELPRLLIENEAALNIQNNKGETPLHRAILNKKLSVELVKLLIIHGAKTTVKNNEGHSPKEIIYKAYQNRKSIADPNYGLGDTELENYEILLNIL